MGWNGENIKKDISINEPSRFKKYDNAWNGMGETFLILSMNHQDLKNITTHGMEWGKHLKRYFHQWTIKI